MAGAGAAGEREASVVLTDTPVVARTEKHMRIHRFRLDVSDTVAMAVILLALFSIMSVGG
jgi:hypothetical protein